MLTELEQETIHIAVDLFSHLSPPEIKQLELDMAQLFENRKKVIDFPFAKIQSTLNN